MTYETKPGDVVAVRGEAYANSHGDTCVLLESVDGAEQALLAEAWTVAPWASAEEWEAVQRLDEAVRDLLTNRGSRFTVQNVLRERYHALADLRARMGW